MNSFQTGTLCTSQLINYALFLYHSQSSFFDPSAKQSIFNNGPSLSVLFVPFIDFEQQALRSCNSVIDSMQHYGGEHWQT